VTQNDDRSISLYEMDEIDGGDGKQFRAQFLHQIEPFGVPERFRFFPSRLTNDGQTIFSHKQRIHIKDGQLVVGEPLTPTTARHQEWTIAGQHFAVHTPSSGPIEIFSIDDLNSPLAKVKKSDDGRRHIPSAGPKVAGIDTASNLTFVTKREHPMNGINAEGVLKYEIVPIPGNRSYHGIKYSFPRQNGKAFLWMHDRDGTGYPYGDRIFIVRHAPR